MARGGRDCQKNELSFLVIEVFDQLDLCDGSKVEMTIHVWKVSSHPRKRTSIEIFVRQLRANNGHARRQSCPLQLMFETMWPSRHRARNVSAVPRNYARQAKQFVFSTSVADLNFLQFSPHTLRGTSNQKGTLESYIC